jgi:hypothetical protein
MVSSATVKRTSFGLSLSTVWGPGTRYPVLTYRRLSLRTTWTNLDGLVGRQRSVLDTGRRCGVASADAARDFDRYLLPPDNEIERAAMTREAVMDEVFRMASNHPPSGCRGLQKGQPCDHCRALYSRALYGAEIKKVLDAYAFLFPATEDDGDFVWEG